MHPEQMNRSAQPLRSEVVPDSETARDFLGEPAEISSHTVPNWFQGLEPGCPRTRVDADAFSGEWLMAMNTVA